MKNIYIGNTPIIEQTGNSTPGTINVNNYLRNPKELSSVLSKVTSSSDLSSYGNCLFCCRKLGDYLYIGYINLLGYEDKSDSEIQYQYDGNLSTYYTTYPVAKIIRTRSSRYDDLSEATNYFVYNLLVNDPGRTDVLDSDKWIVYSGYQKYYDTGGIYIGFLPTLTV